MIDFIFFKIVIGFRWMLCAQFNPILHHFYDLVLNWTIDRFLFLDIHVHMQIYRILT